MLTSLMKKLTGCLLLLASAAVSHELWVTGVAVDVRSGDTTVTVKAHKLNLRTADPAGEISARLQLLLDGRKFEPVDIRLASDALNDTWVWTAKADISGTVVTVERPLFPEIPQDRTVVSITRGGAPEGSGILNADARNVSIGETTGNLVLRFLREGVIHILEGTDHIAFLIAILLPVRRLRQIVQVVTAFTLAHSITLTAAAAGLADVSPRLIEPAIAVSIIIAAAENLHGRTQAIGVRTFYAFGFGLIHGFGFAGSLAESGLPSWGMWPAIGAFNAGVELGQLAIVCVLAPGLALLERKRPALSPAVVRYASLAIIAAGLTWSIQRIVA